MSHNVPNRNWSYPTAIKFGVGRISELAEHCKSAGVQKPLLVTDKALASLPITGIDGTLRRARVKAAGSAHLKTGSLRDVAWVATGFTVAHSLTLAAASLGWVLVDQARVEALIGFSIALVAAENLWLSSARDRKSVV